MKLTNKHIQFEVEVRMSSLGIFGGGVPSTDTNIESPNLSADSSDYKEATIDDINELAKILGGGM